MLCLNTLGIGGVETATLNQTIQLIKRGYKVIILAGNGIYKDKFKETGAKVINFTFETNNKYSYEKIDKVIKILTDYNVEQVHIQQFCCISTVFPACMIKKVPYVAYLHNGILGEYDWFENSFPGYSIMFKLYFDNASKIIAIKESTMLENKEKFNLPLEKYKIIKNSIDFEKFSTTKSYIPKKIKNFLIISRLSVEKEKSIMNAISIFKKYYELDKEAKLTIIGDGGIKDKVIEEIKDIENVTTMLGQRNDVAQIIEENDVVLAVGRCILETIAVKRIAVICGSKDEKEIVTPENIEIASNNNFAGGGLKTKTTDEIVNDIINLEEKRIKNIVDLNYKYAYKNLNSNKNLYILENPREGTMNTETTMKYIMQLENMYVDHIVYTDKVYKECKEAQSFFEKGIENRDIELEKLREFKINVENSRWYKLRNFIKHIIK